MKLSVLVQCYNHEPFLKEAIQSVYIQDLTSTEVIVVDDGSNDGSAAVLKKLQTHYGFELILQQNRGFIPTLNQLLRKAKGEYICMLAGDDYFPAGKFNEQISYLDSNASCAALLGSAVAVDRHSRKLCDTNQVYKVSRAGAVSFDEIFFGLRSLATASAIFRKESLQMINAFPEDVGVEDFWVWLKLISNNHQVICMDKTWAFYRIHGENLHHKSVWMQDRMLRILYDYQDHPLFNSAIKRWRAAYFSELAVKDKLQALKTLPSAISTHPDFFKGILKLFIPAGIWTRWKVR